MFCKGAEYIRDGINGARLCFDLFLYLSYITLIYFVINARMFARSNLVVDLFGVLLRRSLIAKGRCGLSLSPFSAEAVRSNYESADFTDSKLQTVTFRSA